MSYPISDSCQIANLTEIFEKYFDNNANGYFVEIGAYDGYGFSNTWGLAEVGWQGLMIEPVHELADRCRERHKNNSVIVAEYAITDFDGQTKIWLGPNDESPLGTIWPYNSVNEDFACWAANGNGLAYDPERYATVTAITLDKLLEMYLIPFNFDLLVIDVEGAELKVLNSFTWRVLKPKMIIIESNIHSEDIAKWFSETDYHLIQNDGLNSIYVLEVK